MSEEARARELAEAVVSAANIVSYDGYYELDIDAVTRTIIAAQAQRQVGVEEIARLRQLLAKAATLPWKHSPITRGGELVRDEVRSANGSEIIFDATEENVRLLVAAVNALPRLLAALDHPPVAGGE